MKMLNMFLESFLLGKLSDTLTTLKGLSRVYGRRVHVDRVQGVSVPLEKFLLLEPTDTLRTLEWSF